jgi:tight adherence protein C
MQTLQELIGGTNGALIVSAFAFVAVASMVLVFALVLVPVAQSRRMLRQELLEAGVSNPRSLQAQTEIRRRGARKPVEAYFRLNDRQQLDSESIEARLFYAGFYSPNAYAMYQVVRLGLVGVVFFTMALAGPALLPKIPTAFVLIGAALFASFFLFMPGLFLERIAVAKKESFRRGFPDFMDMVITCADAGMSLEAAVDRVSHELAATHKTLGVQLQIMALELRAGKPLRDCLKDMGQRIGIDEARSLAVLFRQSEELGTSLTEALRVFSEEMRSQRILRAEEKANSLPVRMMLPLALFVFPFVMIIIMLPIIIRMKGVFF